MSVWMLWPVLPMIYEDFRYRMIHAYWLLVWGVCILYFKDIQWMEVGANALFLLFLMATLTLYFSAKAKQWVNIINEYLGLGDVLFFIPLTLLFPLEELVQFFIVSSSFCLVLAYLLGKLFPNNDQSIPLAGGMSVCLWMWYWTIP